MQAVSVLLEEAGAEVVGAVEVEAEEAGKAGEVVVSCGEEDVVVV